VQRSCHSLALAELRGSGVVEAVPAGATVSVCVDHGTMGVFRVPGDLRVTSEDLSFECTVAEHHRGDRFVMSVHNTGEDPGDYEYAWSREGVSR